MGIDVRLYAQGDVTEEQFAAAETFIRARVGMDTYSTFERSKYEPNRIELRCGDRYYDESNERGHWPTIYGQIRVLQAALPQCTIHYGGDYYDDADEVTDERLNELWAHFLSDHGGDYRRSAREFNARLASGGSGDTE